MSETKKKHRLFRVAKELNTGSSTLVDHLQQSGYEIKNSPNEKLSEDMYLLLLKEFASERELKAKAEQIKEAKQEKRMQQEEPQVEVEEEFLSAQMLKSGVLDKGSVKPTAKTVATQKETPVTVPEQKKPEAKAPETKAETPAVKDKPTSPRILGKIDLSQFDRKKSRSKKVEKKPEPVKKMPPPAVKPPQKAPEVKAPEVKTPEVKAPEVKTPEVKAPEVKTPEVKTPEVKTPEVKTPEVKTPEVKEKAPEKKVVAETPDSKAPEAKTATPKAKEAKIEPPVKEKPEAKKGREVKASADAPKKGQAKEVTPNKKSEPVEEASSEAKTEPEIIKASDHTPKLAGLQVLGKIELPSARKSRKKDEKSSSSSDSGDDAKKRKRKRRRKRKSPGDSNSSSSSSSNRPNTGRGGRGGGSTGSGGSSGGGGRGRRPDPKKKEEASDKEISEIIKSTLADLNRGASRKGQKKRRGKRETHAERRAIAEQQRAEESRVLDVTEFITANELANLINASVTEVITKCMGLGLFVSINQRLEADVIQLLAEEYGYEVNFVDIAEKEFEEDHDAEDNPEDLVTRAPIITIMGHVDHGKTSLLDYIRDANVTKSEAGGITQHIGAYEVKMENDKRICFLDTPGHEAFTAMRARGAKVTDLVIIVVAADDSVMPQTKEAINHSRSAGVSMIFAINKMDRPQADADRIRQQLSEMDILLEDWGGKYQSQEISAKTGMGVDELLEKVLLEAEMLELKANPKKPARGTVIEARLDKGRGVVATVLVQDGTMRVGDAMVAGVHYARVRAQMNENGERMEEVGPSTPVQILGLSGTPQAGDRFMIYSNPSQAKETAQRRNELYREQSLRQNKRPTLEELARRRALGDFKELNIIVKGDVDGSVEALADSLLKLSVDEIQVNVIHKAVGQISEADVLLASASDAIIIGFQVRPSIQARKLAEGEGIDIRLYSVIYDAINELKDALEGMLSPDVKEEIVGSAEIREVFRITKVGNVAGCMVIDGKMNRKDPIRLIRDGIVIYAGKLSSLKRFKDDAKEVARGYECGMQIDGYNDIKDRDLIEQYHNTEVARKLK
ncbi:MAG TPA: translation initiation factor IF-2 [Bacteroidetes bacterium]|nr:translation initiation factor IF-2 [Bacteroidota bacterium]